MLFLPLYPGFGMAKNLDPAGSAINIPDHISKSSVTIIWVKKAYVLVSMSLN